MKIFNICCSNAATSERLPQDIPITDLLERLSVGTGQFSKTLADADLHNR